MPVTQFSPVVRKKNGRPRGGAHKDASKLINKVIPRKERIELLAELARGTVLSKTDKKGNTVTYTEKPDEKAIRQLNEYDMGKPIDKVDVTSQGQQVSAVALIPPIIRDKLKKKND